MSVKPYNVPVILQNGWSRLYLMEGLSYRINPRISSNPVVQSSRPIWTGQYICNLEVQGGPEIGQNSNSPATACARGLVSSEVQICNAGQFPDVPGTQFIGEDGVGTTPKRELQRTSIRGMALML